MALGDLSGNQKKALNWKPTMQMDHENAAEGFYIHALLLDYKRRGASAWAEKPLSLPNSDTTHRDGRLHDALVDRSHEYSGYLRPGYFHACDGCTAVVERDGKPCMLFIKEITLAHVYIDVIRSMVTDGIMIGHPCCSLHDCKKPLPSNRARYCLDHQDLEWICCTIGCNNPVAPGSKACIRDVCQQLEKGRNDPARHAIFRLRKRHISSYTQGSEAAVGMETTELDEQAAMEIEEDEPTMHLGDGEGNNPSTQWVEASKGRNRVGPKAKAVYGRRRTACDVLAVMSCGHILGRMTMYGSEAVTGIIVSRICPYLTLVAYAVSAFGSTSSLLNNHTHHTSGMTTIAESRLHFKIIQTTH